MKWTAGNRDNVDDVRGQTGGGGAVRMGGLGIGGLLVMLILSWATGVDFLSLLSTDSTSTGPSVSTGTGPSGELRTTPEEERTVDFVDAVMRDAQEMWQTKLGGRYQVTRARIFRDGGSESIFLLHGCAWLASFWHRLALGISYSGLHGLGRFDRGMVAWQSFILANRAVASHG
jgi:hypothetical protein